MFASFRADYELVSSRPVARPVANSLAREEDEEKEDDEENAEEKRRRELRKLKKREEEKEKNLLKTDKFILLAHPNSK